MLNVSYVNPMGYVTEIGNKRKQWLCYANVRLWAEVGTWRHADGKYYRHLGAFFLDNEHLKRFVMNNKTPLKGLIYHFNSACQCNINITTIRLLTYGGAKVEFFYKKRKRKVII